MHDEQRRQGGNSRLAGNAARNCATGCARRAQTGRRPSQTPIGTQIRLASDHQHDHAQQRDAAEQRRPQHIAPVQRLPDTKPTMLPERPDQHRREQRRARSRRPARDGVPSAHPRGAGRSASRSPPMPIAASPTHRRASCSSRVRRISRSIHGSVGRRAGRRLEAELRRPGDQRAEQQLVVRQDHQQHRRGSRRPPRAMSRCSSASAT